ncbi:hypothetical protein BG0491 [Borreliella bavariensis PBi]|uniref:Uncharacterized protein n=1 Tax=Borrelia garinii subsp. bavariensis (strain ATCC BAA-2496 / DSM 23469 / PBi) TaxID=290434 RepID=A0A7I6GWB6_BORGP|nr:hypothetical protein BG0491 [Borreliella bavariensis PBi]
MLNKKDVEDKYESL